MKSLLIALALLLAPAVAAACPSYPYTLTNGQTADANQVMANFNNVLTCVNGLATAGANSNITSLSGLTTPLSVFQGGTGATTGAGAQTNLGGPFLTVANNLSDVNSASASLANLGGAPLLSPAFSGTPTAPTAAPGTNTTQVATTAFVHAALPSTSISYAEFQEQEASGTNSSCTPISPTTWTKRLLNTTLVNTIPGASLTSSQITLPAGTYLLTTTGGLNISVTPAAGAMRIQDTTHSATLNAGPAAIVAASGAQNLAAQTAFVLSGSTVIELDTWITQGLGTCGVPVASGSPEVYTDVLIEKIA